jgi:hypothetical protein
MLHGLYPERSITASIVALRSGKRATASLSLEEREELLSDLKYLGGEILNREFEQITPVRKALCEACDFLPLCRRHEDFG